ncbi:MAG TPA: hypothetical protein VIF12_05975 [Micavibrio sp.]
MDDSFKKFMKALINLPPQPAEMTLEQLGERLGIPNLEDIVDADIEETIASASNADETETLYFRPEQPAYQDGSPVSGRAFELLIDLESAKTYPTLSISFREASEGLFRIARTTRHETMDQMQLPTLENPVIDAVAGMIQNHMRKSPPPPARKPKDLS